MSLIVVLTHNEGHQLGFQCTIIITIIIIIAVVAVTVTVILITTTINAE